MPGGPPGQSDPGIKGVRDHIREQIFILGTTFEKLIIMILISLIGWYGDENKGLVKMYRLLGPGSSSTLFQLKRGGGEDFFSEKNKGAKTFFRQIFPKP